MPGVSFDRAAEYYDATRGYPVGVPEQVRDALARAVGLRGAARVLEFGVGTGRIAQPFVAAGYAYVGVDISQAMLDRLRGKVAHASHAVLLRGDVMHLPLRDNLFDLAIGAHILHLVADWRATLLEAKRTLVPGGQIVLLHDTIAHDNPTTPGRVINERWRALIADLGHPYERAGRRWSAFGIGGEASGFLARLGATCRHVDLVTFDRESTSLRQLADRHITRIYSGDWSLPDAVHASAAAALTHWIDTECPEPDAPVVEQAIVRALIAQWPTSQ